MFVKIQKLSKNNYYENATNTVTDSQLTAINNQISQIYNMDVEAIRNLGAISKSLLTGTNYHTTTPTTPGTLTIPADNTNLKGNLTVNNSVNLPHWGYINYAGRGEVNARGPLVIAAKDGVTIHKDATNSGDLNVAGSASVANSISASRLNLPNWGSINVAGRCNMDVAGPLVIAAKNGVTLYKDAGNSGDLTVGGGASVSGNLDVNGKLKANGGSIMNVHWFGGNYDSDWDRMIRDLGVYMRQFLPSDYSACVGIFQTSAGTANIIGTCMGGRYTYCNSGYGYGL